MTAQILTVRGTTRLATALAMACVLFSPAPAGADVVLDWNATAVSTMLGQSPAPNPFAQARFMAITQLAVFEAVNAVTGEYQPYLGTIDAPAGASADAAASAAALDAERASSLAAIPNGPAKDDGIAAGQAAVGGVTSTERPPDRADVARFYAVSSPSMLLNLAVRQVSVAQGRSLSHNARALALINMAISDGLVASFLTKYHYNYWRPETAIRLRDTDGNPKTEHPRPGRDPALRHLQADHRRRRRRARVRRDPLPLRSGGGWPATYFYKHGLRPVHPDVDE